MLSITAQEVTKMNKVRSENCHGRLSGLSHAVDEGSLDSLPSPTVALPLGVVGHQEFILTYKSFEPPGTACLPARRGTCGARTTISPLAKNRGRRATTRHRPGIWAFKVLQRVAGRDHVGMRRAIEELAQSAASSHSATGPPA